MARLEEDTVELYLSVEGINQPIVVRDRSQVNTIVISIGDEPD